MAMPTDRVSVPQRAAPRPTAMNHQARVGYLLILPAIVIVVAISLYPLMYQLWLSLTDWYLLQSPDPVFAGLDNYRRLAADDAFRASLGRAGIWTVGTVLIEYALALPIALLLNRRSPVTGFLTGVLLLPWVTPTIVVAYTWRWLFDSEFGAIHVLLQGIGIAGERSLMAEPSAVLPALIVVSAWKGAPFMAVALLATMKSIPPELYEAAAIDGASRLRQFADITMPLLRRVSVVMGLLLGILAFYSFDIVWVITKGGPSDATMLVGVYLFRLFFERLELSYAATIGVVMLGLLIVVSLIYLRLAGRTRDE